MSDVDQNLEATEETEETSEGDASNPPKKRRFSGKVLILYIVLPLLVLSGGGYFAADYFGLLSMFKTDQKIAGVKRVEPPKPAIFFDLPEMLVNLNQQGSRARYLKLRVSFEMTDSEVKQILTPLLPRLIDTFQVYLRELRAGDLEGSAGIYRLKEELLRRVNISIRPLKIDRVLFREMLVQ